MLFFESNQQKLAYTRIGTGETIYIWAHGWGHSHMALQQTAQALTPLGTHILIDFPGFGQSPQPPTDWTISDYAHFMHDFILSLQAPNIIWIGHSFGCRVGIKMAALYPDDFKKLILMAAPGLPRKRSLIQSFRFTLRARLFKLLKHVLWRQEWKDRLRYKFSSADFNNAGTLRGIFLNTIREDLAHDAQKIKTPTLLLCGANDEDTPPDITTRYTKLISGSSSFILDGLDHYSILTAPQIPFHIKQFVTS